MTRNKKWIRVRKPRVYVDEDGVKVSSPSVRVGGKTGLNVSRRGVSVSTGGKWWSFNSRRGCLLKLPGCLLPTLLLIGGLAWLIVDSKSSSRLKLPKCCRRILPT